MDEATSGSVYDPTVDFETKSPRLGVVPWEPEWFLGKEHSSVLHHRLSLVPTEGSDK